MSDPMRDAYPLTPEEAMGNSVKAGREWFQRVRPGGAWDFKRHGHREYEQFGNEAYGVTGKSLGLPDGVLKRGAGWAQETFNEPGHGYDPRWGHWWEGAPYGDDPADQRDIQTGIEFYDRKRRR